MERTQFITCPCSQQVFFCAEHCYLSSRLAPTCSSWQLCFLEKSHMELGFSSQISELKYILICPYSRFPELKIGRHSLVIMIFYVGMSDLSNVMSRSRHTLTLFGFAHCTEGGHPSCGAHFFGSTDRGWDSPDVFLGPESRARESKHIP